ncbi:methyltransferase [Rhodobacteraceae bacterium SC52]|nr:methyltransferase [Rhodobacteraceae bacterium SC52]
MGQSLTHDAFLGGRLHIWQPKRGYRAGMDPVLLAASIPARAGQTVLDLGCGVGTAALCLATRVPGLSLTGVEVQPDYADLARRNANEAKLPLDVVTADLRALPRSVSARSFDHVLTNPPYFQRAQGTESDDAGRETAMGEEVPFAVWLDAAIKRVRPGGTLTVIQRMGRLPEALAAIGSRLGACEVLPITGRPRQHAETFLLHAVKGRRTPFRLCPPLVTHQGESHRGDREHYTAPLMNVLRNAAAMPGYPNS